MTISSDLFQAILPMEACNRGYDRGFAVTGDQVEYGAMRAEAEA